MATLDYKDALAFVKKVNSADGTGSLYEHLTQVLQKVLEEKPANAVDLLETSLLIKKKDFKFKEPSSLLPVHSAADAARAVAAAKLFGNGDLPIDPETGEPAEAEPANEYECEDVVKDANLFEALGVGLGRNEMYGVMLAVKQLGEDPKRAVSTVRFFGKFLGTYADYYVFETTLQNPPEEEEKEPAEGEAPVEPSGTGANGYTYFVCSHLGGPLTQLPNVTPAQIKAARTIKKFLTGKLDAHVSTYPVFPGTERNYLRAQIARVAATTVCCPANLFTANEEGGIDRAEEFEPQPAREYGLPANWSHRYPHLKQQGRCILHKREPPEGEEDEFEPTEEEQEEGPEPLTTLDSDTPVANDAAWSPLYSSSNENVKNQVAGLRSNLWPGAFCAIQGSHFTNIYVGWGVKNAPFLPLPPPPVAQEYDQAMVESVELPPKYKPEPEPEADADE